MLDEDNKFGHKDGFAKLGAGMTWGTSKFGVTGVHQLSDVIGYSLSQEVFLYICTITKYIFLFLPIYTHIYIHRSDNLNDRYICIFQPSEMCGRFSIGI